MDRTRKYNRRSTLRATYGANAQSLQDPGFVGLRLDKQKNWKQLFRARYAPQLPWKQPEPGFITPYMRYTPNGVIMTMDPTKFPQPIAFRNYPYL